MEIFVFPVNFVGGHVVVGDETMQLAERLDIVLYSTQTETLQTLTKDMTNITCVIHDTTHVPVSLLANSKLSIHFSTNSNKTQTQSHKARKTHQINK